MKLIKKFFQLVVLPLFLAGAFFVWCIPRITTDWNFNTDELLYLKRSEYGYAYTNRDFTNPIWQAWGSFDQPQLTNYIYSLVPGDRSVIDKTISPCPDSQSKDIYIKWGCLAGKPMNEWTSGTQPIASLLLRARIFAVFISAIVITTTYFAGYFTAGPFAGLIAAVYLGWFSFFQGRATMVMMDQILLILLNIQICIAALLFRSKKISFGGLTVLAVVTGLAASTKFNAVPPTVLMYALLTFQLWRSKQKFILPKLLYSAVVSIGLFAVLNPFIWPDPIGNSIKMVNWRLDQGHMQQASDPANAINSVKEGVQFLYHLGTIDRDRNISLSTPLLVIGIIGLLYVLIRRDSRYLSLMIMGSIALVAAYVPVKWDRYVLPAIPLLGILFGAGIYAITELRKVKLSTIFMGVIATLIMASVVWAAKFLPASEAFIFGITTLLTVQGAIVTTAMLYGFTHKNDDATEANHIEASQKSFTLILPVRNEASVIRATIAAMDRINYPKDLYEVLITVRSDDFETIRAINAAFETIKPVNMRTIIIGSAAQTKAHSLNTALSQTKGEIIGVFDAEDEPQPDLLERINQELDIHPQYAAVQAPVQLVNLNSSWYSTLNSLEYYFWFQSVLPFLSQNGLTPLGGNTIFINKNILEEMDGWDEKCLTEDADMGIRLSQAGYSVGVVTDLELATREEAPLDELGVIKQRSRWDQGYLQVLGKGNWKSLPLKQKILAIYTLTQPIFRHIAFLNMFIAPILGIVLHVSTAIALISFIPSYFLLMQWGMYLIGLKELSKKFAIRVSPFKYIATILFFYPYQALLSLATFRAIGKLLTGNNVWDKTLHYNAHRPALAVSPAPSYT